MEQVLTSAILVCLAGVMFESDRFSSDDSVFAWQAICSDPDVASLILVSFIAIVFYPRSTDVHPVAPEMLRQKHPGV